MKPRVILERGGILRSALRQIDEWNGSKLNVER